MNWFSGLFRLCIVLSAVWFIIIIGGSSLAIFENHKFLVKQAERSEPEHFSVYQQNRRSEFCELVNELSNEWNEADDSEEPCPKYQALTQSQVFEAQRYEQALEAKNSLEEYWMRAASDSPKILMLAIVPAIVLFGLLLLARWIAKGFRSST